MLYQQSEKEKNEKNQDNPQQEEEKEKRIQEAKRKLEMAFSGDNFHSSQSHPAHHQPEPALTAPMDPPEPHPLSNPAYHPQPPPGGYYTPYQTVSQDHQESSGHSQGEHQPQPTQITQSDSREIFTDWRKRFDEIGQQPKPSLEDLKNYRGYDPETFHKSPQGLSEPPHRPLFEPSLAPKPAPGQPQASESLDPLGSFDIKAMVEESYQKIQQSVSPLDKFKRPELGPNNPPPTTGPPSTLSGGPPAISGPLPGFERLERPKPAGGTTYSQGGIDTLKLIQGYK